MTDNSKLQKEYKIHVHETGTDSKLNLASLFNYLQDIASEHAEILGFGRADLMQHNHFWALSRVYAEISELITPPEESCSIKNLTNSRIVGANMQQLLKKEANQQVCTKVCYF